MATPQRGPNQRRQLDATLTLRLDDLATMTAEASP